MKKKLLKTIGVCLIISICLGGCKPSKQKSSKKKIATTATEEKVKDDQTCIKELGQNLNIDASNFSTNSLKLFDQTGGISVIKYKNSNKIEAIKWTIPYTETDYNNICDRLVKYYNDGQYDVPNEYDIYTYDPTDDNIKEISLSYNYENINVIFSAEKDKLSTQRPKRTAYEAYNRVINTDLDSLGTDDNGDPAYEDVITLTQDSQKDVELDMYDGMMPPDAVYIKLLYCIEGSYILQNGWKTYSPYIFDPAPKTYSQFKAKREKIKSLFKTDKPSPNLYRHLKKLKSVQGTLTISNGLASGCDFEITNIKKCAKELHISQECVGYILAYFYAHDCDIDFGDDHNSCTVVDSNTYNE